MTMNHLKRKPMTYKVFMMKEGTMMSGVTKQYAISMRDAPKLDGLLRGVLKSTLES